MGLRKRTATGKRRKIYFFLYFLAFRFLRLKLEWQICWSTANKKQATRVSYVTLVKPHTLALC